MESSISMTNGPSLLKNVETSIYNKHIGIFLISLSMLMYQVLITRILSVTVFYHFAFVAVSLAMFGLALGAVIVTSSKRLFADEYGDKRAGEFSLAFGWCAFTSVYIHRTFLVDEVWGTITFLLLTIAFTLGGISICLCLTKNQKHVSGLYASDLVGAAIGSIILLVILPFINGPAAIILVLISSALTAVAFLWNTRAKKVKAISYASVMLGLFLLVVELSRPIEDSFFRLMSVRKESVKAPLFERWNSFSRVTVNEMGHGLPFGWGLSRKYDSEARIDQKYLEIDSGASTPLTKFDGSFDKLGHLKADVTNIVYYLRPMADVFVVGVGGGRDVLTALIFNARSITGAEINDSIIEATKEKFRDYVGNLLGLKQVRVVNDEARSYISRESATYDVIQISLVDTFAASSGGAFVLSENSLYTVEAWRAFIKKLKPNGLFSVSRWWNEDLPIEGLRTIALAREALIAEGIEHPEKHILVSINKDPLYKVQGAMGIVTVILSKDEISSADVSIFRDVSKSWDFEVLLAPTGKVDPIVWELMTSGYKKIRDRLSIEITPPTDGAPFFFHMARIKEVILGGRGDKSSLQMSRMLLLVLFVIVIISYRLLITPYKSRIKSTGNSGKWPILLYFISIGLGFMLIEISQIQLFSTFLGHPTYGIAVVLFSLLISTGLGSFLSKFFIDRKERYAMFLLGIAVISAGILSPLITASFRESLIPTRIIVSLLVLSPLGVALGFGFPLGMRLIERKASELATLAWGLNGAASVVAGIGAVLISIHAGIATSYWSGFVAYIIAICGFLIASSQRSVNVPR